MRSSPFSTAFTVGFDTLRANPLRTVLSTLGIIIGVGSLVAVLSVGDGLEDAMRLQISETTDLQTISVQPRTSEDVDGQRFPIRDPVEFTVDDASALAATPGVDGVTLAIMGFVEVRSTDGLRRRMATIRGQRSFPPTYPDVPLLAGRRLAPRDLEGSAPRIMLSADLARALSPDSNEHTFTQRAVMVADKEAEVVGVIAGSPGGTGSRPASRGIYLVGAPFDFARAAISGVMRPVPTLAVHAAKVEQTAVVRRRIESWFSARDTAWARRVSVSTSEMRLEQASTGILMFKLFMGAITGISLLVGGIGIMNVLLSSVIERTREIGIRKAAGARDGDIRLQFLAESVAISSVGSALGLILGIAGAFGITAIIRRFARAPFLHASLSWSTLVVAAAAALFVGLAFGTYPARRAAKLSPIDAIRHE
jgi:putative ABC transport system permease protein